MSSFRAIVARRPAPWPVALALWALAGCRAAPPDPRAEALIGDALGMAAAVTFQVEARPVDEVPLADDVLTLAAATQRAVQTDPGLQAALAQVRVALADAEQARLLPNPILSLEIGWFAGSPWINAGAEQDLVTALLSGRRASAADHRLRAATATAVRAALDLVQELQAGYVDVQASDALVPLLQQRLELAEQVLQLTRERAAAGDVAEIDVTTLEAARLDVQLELDLAEREQRQRRLRLARLLGEPNGSGLWRLEPLHPVPDVDEEEGRQVQLALDRRPEVLELRWELAALGDEAAIAGWTVLAGDGVGVSMQKQQGETAYGPTIGLPLPLFDTGAVRVRRAEMVRAGARHELLALQRRIVEEVRAARANLRATRAYEARLVRELLPRLRERRSSAEIAYSSGQTDVTPLLLAEDDLRNAEVKAVLYRQQAATALLELRRAVAGSERDPRGVGS
ncbi:MAG: TolC family protein [Planctomycetes bacterium]|nr:TolC family protein [Planctomycetota bacterium]